jgi:hydroxypyruvate reductase
LPPQLPEKIGVNTLLLTSTIEGEAKTVGTLLSSVASEIVASGNPLATPAAVIVGGETTVKVMEKGLVEEIRRLRCQQL